MAVAEPPPLGQEREVLSNDTPSIFWLRAIALVVDLVIISGISVVAGYVFGIARPVGWSTSALGGAFSGPLLAGRQLWLRVALFGLIFAALLVFCGAFFYYGRPALVIEGMVNAQQGPFANANPYSANVSALTWGNGTITYHVGYATNTPSQYCNATETLRWQGIYGWQPGYGQVSCLPRR